MDYNLIKVKAGATGIAQGRWDVPLCYKVSGEIPRTLQVSSLEEVKP